MWAATCAVMGDWNWAQWQVEALYLGANKNTQWVPIKQVLELLGAGQIPNKFSPFSAAVAQCVTHSHHLIVTTSATVT